MTIIIICIILNNNNLIEYQKRKKITKKMYSFNKVKKSSQINSSQNYKALAQIHDKQQYQFSPQVQQYKFKSPSKYQSNTKIDSKIIKNSSIHNKGNQSHEQQRRIIQMLKSKVHALQQQNEQLKIVNNGLQTRLQKLQQQLNKLNKPEQLKSIYKLKQVHKQYQLPKAQSIQKKLLKSNKSSRFKHLNSSTSSTSLLKQLLLDCNQSQQFKNTPIKSLNQLEKKWQRDNQFFQYKTTRECCQPFYSHLKRELQLRLRKAILRDKELIIKNDLLEVGCICSQVGQYQFEVQVIITNITINPITNITIGYLHKNDIQLIKQQKSKQKVLIQNSSKCHSRYKQLLPTQQLKQTLLISCLTIDYRCIILSLQYNDYTNNPQSFYQLLPTTKHRLFTQLIISPIPQQYCIVQNVIIVDNKVLPGIDKLKTYYKKVYFTNHNRDNQQAIVKIMFLKRYFFIKFRQMPDAKWIISVLYQQGTQQLAQKILQEITFVFQK